MLANTLGNNAQQALAGGELSQALELADDALRIGRSINNPSAVSFAQTLRGFVFLQRGEVAQGLQALQEAVEAGEAGNNAYGMTGIRAELGWALACTGAIEDGLGLAHLAVDEAVQHFQSARDWTAAILARICLVSGDLPSAQAALPQADFVLTDEHLTEAAMFGGVAIGMAAGELALAQGRTDLALGSVDRLITHLQRLGARLYLADALRLQGKILQAEGRVEEAHQALLDARAMAIASGTRFAAWSILDALADLRSCPWGYREVRRAPKRGERNHCIPRAEYGRSRAKVCLLELAQCADRPCEGTKPRHPGGIGAVRGQGPFVSSGAARKEEIGGCWDPPRSRSTHEHAV